MPEIKLDVPEGARFFSLTDVGAMLVRHAGLHEGLFEVSLRFDVNVGVFRQPLRDASPGVLCTVAEVGLVPTTQQHPLTIDAANVNPRPATAGRASPAAKTPAAKAARAKASKAP